MSEPVDGSNEIIHGHLRRIFLNDGSQSGIVRISQKNRLHIGICDAHMLHAVFLFVLAGQLVLLDSPRQVIVHRSTQHDAVLGVPVHGLGIKVVHRFFIFHQPPVTLEFGEILCRLLIHTSVMLVCPHREINLRADNVIQRHLIVTGFVARFFRSQHVVWPAFHFFHQILWRTKPFERSDQCHFVLICLLGTSCNHP